MVAKKMLKKQRLKQLQ